MTMVEKCTAHCHCTTARHYDVEPRSSSLLIIVPANFSDLVLNGAVYRSSSPECKTSDDAVLVI